MGWLEEFYSKFEHPYVNDTTVGFSGIDPAPLGSNSGISMDGVLIDDTDDEKVYDHEELENLLGGEEFDHYHLTGEEYMQLQEMLERKQDEDDNGEISITLTQDEYEKLLALFEAVYLDDSSTPILINEDTLNDLIEQRIIEYMNEIDDNG